MHTKPFVNFKLSFLLPGIGFEFGLGKYMSLNTMLKTGFGYRLGDFFFNPYLTTQLRFYYDQNKRKFDNVRTYKYSGNYLCIVHSWSPQSSSVYDVNTNHNVIGFEHGWQRTFGKHWYHNIAIGAAYGIENANYYLLYDYDIGYNF